MFIRRSSIVYCIQIASASTRGSESLDIHSFCTPSIINWAANWELGLYFVCEAGRVSPVCTLPAGAHLSRAVDERHVIFHFRPRLCRDQLVEVDRPAGSG